MPSIFDSPALVKKQLELEEQNRLFNENRGDPGLMFIDQAASGLGNSLAKALGRPEMEDPRIAQARKVQSALQGVDRNTPEGQIKFAQKLDEIGLVEQADAIRTQAVDNYYKKMMAEAQYANATKTPGLDIKEIGVEGGMRQKAALDKEGNVVKLIGSPYKPGSAATVNVDNSEIMKMIGKTDARVIRQRIQSRKSLIDNVDETLQALYKMPGAVGFIGSGREKAGGVAGILGLSSLESALSPTELTEARTRLRALSLEAAKALVDEPRITESERQIASEIAKGLSPTASYRQSVEALKILYEITSKAQKRDLDLESGEFPFQDYAIKAPTAEPGMSAEQRGEQLESLGLSDEEIIKILKSEGHM